MRIHESSCGLQVHLFWHSQRYISHLIDLFALIHSLSFSLIDTHNHSLHTQFCILTPFLDSDTVHEYAGAFSQPCWLLNQLLHKTVGGFCLQVLRQIIFERQLMLGFLIRRPLPTTMAIFQSGTLQE